MDAHGDSTSYIPVSPLTHTDRALKSCLHACPRRLCTPSIVIVQRDDDPQLNHRDRTGVAGRLPMTATRACQSLVPQIIAAVPVLKTQCMQVPVLGQGARLLPVLATAQSTMMYDSFLPPVLN